MRYWLADDQMIHGPVHACAKVERPTGFWIREGWLYGRLGVTQFVLVQDTLYGDAEIAPFEVGRASW